MDVGERLRQIREVKKLSQGDIENRTGLLRCYISRVENGHTVPSLETLEKLSRALELSLYQLFYEGEETPDPIPPSSVRENDWASRGQGLRIFTKLRRALSRMSDKDRQIILAMAVHMSNGNSPRKP